MLCWVFDVRMMVCSSASITFNSYVRFDTAVRRLGLVIAGERVSLALSTLIRVMGCILDVIIGGSDGTPWGAWGGWGRVVISSRLNAHGTRSCF